MRGPKNEWWNDEVLSNKESFEKKVWTLLRAITCPENTFYGCFLLGLQFHFQNWSEYFFLCSVLSLLSPFNLIHKSFLICMKNGKLRKMEWTQYLNWQRKRNVKRLKLFMFHKHSQSHTFLIPPNKCIHTVELPLCHSLKTILGVDLTRERLLKLFRLFLLSLNLFLTKPMYTNIN